MNPYAELHCQSTFSLLDGGSTPERLVETAKLLGYRALALTDFMDLGGIVRFAEHAKTVEFDAIIGVQIMTTIGNYTGRLVLLAENVIGYTNISRLVTHARMESIRGVPSIPWSTVQTHSDGIFCLSGGSRGSLYRSLSRQDQLSAKRIIRALYSVYEDRFAVEVVHHGIVSEMECAQTAIRYAQEMQIPWVVANDTRYARVQDREVYDVLRCINARARISTAGEILHPNAEWSLKTRTELWSRWSDAPEGLVQSIHIAERCAFRLGMLDMPLPEAVFSNEFHTADDYLKYLVQQGMEHRWVNRISSVHRQQIHRELSLICKRGLSGYFLIMWEIVSFARTHDILVQGRGSAANSAVCYVLGITAVDPIAHQLLFERFLSDARDGYPDIDLDIEHARREEVIQFVYDKYGRDRAAMVCAHQCFRHRSAVRDVAKVLDFQQGDVDRLAVLAHRYGGLSIKLLSDEGWQADDVRLRSLTRVSNELVGLPRQRGTHSGGFVLSAMPIGDAIPIEPAAMAGRSIIQWDKDDLDSMKIPKFDLLGLGILTAIAHGLRLIRDRYELPVHLYQLPQAPEVYDMIGRADTVGLFQIESRAQMNSLPRTQPRTLYELAIQVALIRPGPLQGDMVHPYIRRRRGEEPVDLIHPLIAPILERTLGVPLFQEQGMRLAVEVGGFTPTEAERLRRAISSARSRDQFPGLLQKLKAGMRSNGVSAEAAERLVKHIAAFSTYGFPESHSTSFALLVYASAWIKCRYPAEYLVALLHAQPLGFYTPDILISDAQRHGVNVVSPCLKKSRWHTQLVGSDVIIGLRWIRGLGPQSRRVLERARQQGAFHSFEAVFQRCSFPKDAWLTLVQADAFRHLIQGDRRRAAWIVLRELAAGQLSLPLRLQPEAPVSLPQLSDQEAMEHDYASMHLTTGAHPMSFYRERMQKHMTVSRDLVALNHGQWVRVAGIVIARQKPETAKGFCFISLEDEYGFMNVIVSPKRFEWYWKQIVRARALMVSGTLCLEQGVCNIKALHVESLDQKETAMFPKSHDFR